MYNSSPFGGQQRGRAGVGAGAVRRTPSNGAKGGKGAPRVSGGGPRVVRANSVGTRAPSPAGGRPASPGPAAKRLPPNGLTTEELHCFDILQMGHGGSIRVDEIVSPPTLRSSATGGVQISEESELNLYRGGMPYTALTPVLVRIENAVVHFHKLHDGRHLISLPCADIKKIDSWEGNGGHFGLRLSCGSLSPTEVSLSISEKTKRTALHKILMLKTRGVILPIGRDTYSRRSVSPSVYGGGWNRSTSNLDSRYDNESQDTIPPSPRTVSASAGSQTRGGYTASPSPLTAGTVAAAASAAASVRSQTLQSRYGAGAPTKNSSYLSAMSSGPTLLVHEDPAPVEREEPPREEYNVIAPEDGDRERRRQRIKQQLQDRRAERAKQQGRVEMPMSGATPTPERYQEEVGGGGGGGGGGTPQGQVSSSPGAAPDTDEAARKIAHEKRLQRQLHYEDMLEEERRLRKSNYTAQRNGI